VFAPTIAAGKAEANAVRVITHFALRWRETLLAHEALNHPEKLDLNAIDGLPARPPFGTHRSTLRGLPLPPWNQSVS